MKIEGIIVPEGYKSSTTLIQTEVNIKKIKDFFERELAEALNLTRVSAPLFVDTKSGVNDNLNGIERPVKFDLLLDDMSELFRKMVITRGESCFNNEQVKFGEKVDDNYYVSLVEDDDKVYVPIVRAVDDISNRCAQIVSHGVHIHFWFSKV